VTQECLPEHLNYNCSIQAERFFSQQRLDIHRRW